VALEARVRRLEGKCWSAHCVTCTFQAINGGIAVENRSGSCTHPPTEPGWLLRVLREINRREPEGAGTTG